MRQPKLHQKRGQIFSGAEKRGEHLLANLPEDATAKNCDADDSRRPCARSLILRSTHRPTKNNASEFTKAKNHAMLRHRSIRVAIKVARCGNHASKRG